MRRPLYLLAATVILAGATLVLHGVLKQREEPKDIASLVPPAGTSTPAKVSEPAPVEASSTSPAVPLGEPHKVTAPVQGAAVTPPPPAPDTSTIAVAELQAASAALEGALVNIICITNKGSKYHSISATGVFITSTGYVLTSAHVAAYYLLPEKEVECVLRTGSPATSAYQAKLVFISPSWVMKNAHLLQQAAPQDTGEFDYAILAVSSSVNSTPLPKRYPYVPLAKSSVPAGTSVVVGSYGAQYLSLEQITSALSPTMAASVVRELLTFKTSSPDILLLAGSAVAQEGSSGGGVISLDRQLIGSITTSSISGTIASRVLSALSASYIRRQYRAETGLSLDSLLVLAPSAAETLFAPWLSTLSGQLQAAN